MLDYARLLFFLIMSVMTDYQTKTDPQKVLFYIIDQLAVIRICSSKIRPAACCLTCLSTSLPPEETIALMLVTCASVRQRKYSIRYCLYVGMCVCMFVRTIA